MTINRHRTRGFTLLELMITVSIAAILTIMAVSSYQTSVLTSRRTDAKTALNDIAGREQRYFSVTNSYTASPVALGYSTSATTFGTTFSIGSGYYYLSVSNVNAATAGTPATFTATATATGSQVKDAACATLSIDSTGNYTSTGTGTANPPCWP
ncbi:MAG: type IV pilin protein [Steroidobacterales bacterium]